MGKGKNDRRTAATTATPMKVKGLLGVMEAEATGQDWELDDSDPLAGISFGLGASPESRRLALIGLLSTKMTEIHRKLEDLKSKRGRPKAVFSIDVLRAAAVLGADDLWISMTGQSPPTQKAAIELAQQIDEILCAAEPERKRLFRNMTGFPRLQDSVSQGLNELGPEGKRFLKK